MQYSYPSDIKAASYNNRRVVIYVMEMDVYKTAKLAVQSVTDAAVSAASAVTGFDFQTAVDNKEIHKNKLLAGSTMISSIVLPLPNSLSDSQNHDWSNDSGIIGTAGKGLMNTNLGTIFGSDKGTGKKGLLTKLMGSVGSAVGGMSADQALGSTMSTMGVRKPLANPGYFQNYSGSAPRSFSMAWSFIPNNTEEAHAILGIIMQLKQYASPSKTMGGVSLLAPNYFSVDIANKYISGMIDLDRVVISNLSVDYGADGFMQQTADGMPKFITLNITFNEVDMKTQEDYSTSG